MWEALQKRRERRHWADDLCCARRDGCPGCAGENLTVPVTGSNMSDSGCGAVARAEGKESWCARRDSNPRPSARSEEHTSELQSLMRISYAVFCLNKNNMTRTYELS